MVYNVNDMYHLEHTTCFGTELDDIIKISPFADHKGIESGWLFWEDKHICSKCALDAVELWLHFRR